ncbi:hypothetical protein GTP90_00690 [Rugamonas sp. FT81W]|uniref:Uncharacterized protein n=1 Tax=Duganella vulcania TaxID=2692166 RepID=A0A845GG43_9BURK|nr:hypothetical protein [Duganella vulcania]
MQGVRWLRREGFTVVAKELQGVGYSEPADMIGFRASCSVLLRPVDGREEFEREMQSPRAQAGTIGLYRLFICPPGVIQTHELPFGWGLLYATERSIEEVVRPPGNIWPGPGTKIPAVMRFQHQPDPQAERQVLFALCRKMAAGENVE